MADTKTVAPKEGPGTRAWNWLTQTQVWTSIFRHDRPDTDRGRVLVMLSNVFLHLHPVRIRKSGVKLRYTWCMGGLSFFLFLSLTSRNDIAAAYRTPIGAGAIVLGLLLEAAAFFWIRSLLRVDL